MFKKIPHLTSREILEKADISTEIRKTLDPDITPEAMLDTLATPDTMLDYLRFFAHAVPAREAICWALAVIKTLRPPTTPDGSEALEEVTAWLLDPSETRRRLCMGLVDRLGHDGPAGWLCLAVAWCGSGSIVSANLPEVMPPLGLHAKAVFGAVALCLPDSTEERVARLSRIDTLARRVAEGNWPELFEQESH